MQLQGNVQLGRVWSARAGSGQSARAGSGWVELARQEQNGMTLGSSVITNFL